MAQSLELTDVLNRPGVYFNPQTEVLVVVDDSPEMDREIFNLEDFEGAEWVLISDEVPVDEERRDTLLEQFQTHYHPGGSNSISATSREGEDEDGEEADDQEVGRED